MEEKVIQLVSNINGHFVEVSYEEALFQCMDLAYLYIFCLGIPKATIQHGQASEIWTGATDFTRQYFDLIENTIEAIPQAGDIVVWNTKYGKYGHVGIATGDSNQNNFMVFEQNNPLGTNAHVQSRSYTNVSGWLRPKNVIIDGVPKWLTTLLQEINLNIQNESEIRVIFDKAKRYNDEVAVLQSQVKSANEQLADKALEVSSLIGKNESLTSQVEDLNTLYNNAKTERDSFSWENDKLKIENTTLKEDVESKTTRIEQLENDILADQGFWNLISLAFKSLKKKKGSD